jgi:hypothetical protein
MISIAYRKPKKKPPHLRTGNNKLNARISDTLDRVLAKPPSKVTTLKEMSPEKQAAIRALYETRENGR